MQPGLTLPALRLCVCAAAFVMQVILGRSAFCRGWAAAPSFGSSGGRSLNRSQCRRPRSRPRFIPTQTQIYSEIPEAIKNLFDDWDQSVLISIETILDEPGLVRTIISVNMEPLNLEYEGHDYFIYNLDFEFTNPTSWHVARVNITPEYFVPDE